MNARKNKGDAMQTTISDGRSYHKAWEMLQQHLHSAANLAHLSFEKGTDEEAAIRAEYQEHMRKALAELHQIETM